MTADMTELDDLIARLEKSLVIARECGFATLAAEIEEHIRGAGERADDLRAITAMRTAT
jgi:hypothetical protein